MTDTQRFNPYADFGGTRTDARFIGRESELRMIASRVFGAGGYGSVAVVGLPRVGKSSLVSEAIRRAEARAGERRTVVVRVNVGEFVTVGELFRRLIEDLVDAIDDQGLGNDEIGRRTTKALGQPETDFSAVRAVFRSLRRTDIRPVCVLDEFDAGRRLFKQTPQCFHWLRELSSNPAFKAALVIVAKRRLQEVARLAGHESDYWANVLMTLTLKPFLSSEVDRFFATLEGEGVTLGETEQRDVLALCGGNPYLLEGIAFHAWDRVEQGERIDSEWIRTVGGELVREYLLQVSTILKDGPMLSKAVQVVVGPQWDVTTEDIAALCELGVLYDEDGELRGFSRTFEDHLRVEGRDIDIWPLWRETERALRDVLEWHLQQVHGSEWANGLVRSRPRLRRMIEECHGSRERERKLFGRASASLLAYTYPMQLYELMAGDWRRLAEPLLGRDKQDWAANFKVLAKVRNPLAHNREEAVTAADRKQAEGICHAILERYQRWKSAGFGNGHPAPERPAGSLNVRTASTPSTGIDASWYRRPPDTPERLTAGGLVCSLRDGHLLVALAREGDWPACIIPKGGVDPGEEVEAAARREIEEETGFSRLTLLGKLGVLERLTFDRSHWTVTHLFAYLTAEQEATPSDRAAHPQPALWCRPDDLPPMLWPDQRRLIERNQARLRRWIDRFRQP